MTHVVDLNLWVSIKAMDGFCPAGTSHPSSQKLPSSKDADSRLLLTPRVLVWSCCYLPNRGPLSFVLEFSYMILDF